LDFDRTGLRSPHDRSTAVLVDELDGQYSGFWRNEAKYINSSNGAAVLAGEVHSKPGNNSTR
jgi:hypothetical protein